MNPSDIKEGILEHLNVPYNVDIVRLAESEFIIEKVTSVILGVIAYSIFLLITIVTAIDIAYITLPSFRERIQNLRLDGTKALTLRAVSRDAIFSVEQAALSDTGRSALSIYLGRRIKAYVISFTILIIIVGGAEFIKGFVVNIATEFLKVLFE